MIGPDFSVVGGMTSLNRMIMEESSDTVSIKFSPSMHQRRLFGRASLWIRNIVSAPIIRATKPPDIVHIHVSTGLSIWRKTSIGNLWNLLGIPVVYHTHGSKIKDYIGNSSILTRKIIGRRFRKAAMIVALSEGWKEWYSDTLGLDSKRVSVIPTPIIIPERERLRKGVDFLYSGLMGDRKGTFDLIKAWSLIPDDERGCIQLHLIGNGKVREASNLVDKLGIGDSCIVHGWVSEKEKEDLMGRCGVYVLPSYNEGLPMGLLEAMAWGLAPISSNVGAIPEVISDGENGILVGAGEIEDLSLAIRKMIENPEEVDRMSEMARQTAENHEWTMYFEKLINTWKEILEH